MCFMLAAMNDTVYSSNAMMNMVPNEKKLTENDEFRTEQPVDAALHHSAITKPQNDYLLSETGDVFIP